MRARTPRAALCLIAAAALAVPSCGPPAHEEGILKIGVLGVMSGPDASWGLVNKHCAEVAAKMFNEDGGILIDGQTHRIKIVSVDTKGDPEIAVAGAKKLIDEEGVRYILGPNVDTSAVAIMPIVRAGRSLNIAYGFDRSLFTSRESNTFLGMVASYQAEPLIYAHLKEERDVRTIGFISRLNLSSLNATRDGIKIAKRIGLEVVNDGPLATLLRNAYSDNMLGYRPVLGDLLEKNPDLIVLSEVSPSDAPELIETIRRLGYRGILYTATGQDIDLLREAGVHAEGFISAGGATTPETQSVYMDRFIARYVEHVGEWHEEARTKVYALEFIVRVLRQLKATALDDAGEFIRFAEGATFADPFVRKPRRLRLVGKTEFNQLRQLDIPIVINTVKDGAFSTLLVGELPE